MSSYCRRGTRSSHRRDPLRKIEHALNRAVYEWAEDDVGPVLVTDRHGTHGRFDRDGSWVSGELRSRRFETEETF